MTPGEALQVIDQVGAAFVGNRQDHQKIQIAISVLATLVRKDQEESDKANLKSSSDEAGETPSETTTEEQTT